jgi:hypothetical protein
VTERMKRKQVAIGVGVAAVVAGLIADIRYNGLVRRTI